MDIPVRSRSYILMRLAACVFPLLVSGLKGCAKVLDALVTDELDGGPWTDKRLVTALGCIKADILRFGSSDLDQQSIASPRSGRGTFSAAVWLFSRSQNARDG